MMLPTHQIHIKLKSKMSELLLLLLIIIFVYNFLLNFIKIYYTYGFSMFIILVFFFVFNLFKFPFFFLFFFFINVTFPPFVWNDFSSTFCIICRRVWPCGWWWTKTKNYVCHVLLSRTINSSKQREPGGDYMVYSEKCTHFFWTIMMIIYTRSGEMEKDFLKFSKFCFLSFPTNKHWCNGVTFQRNWRQKFRLTVGVVLSTHRSICGERESEWVRDKWKKLLADKSMQEHTHIMLGCCLLLA